MAVPQRYTKPSEEEQCTAWSKNHKRRCGNWRMRGTHVCKNHGGRLPQVQAKVRFNRIMAEAESFGLSRNIDPADALVELVHRWAGIVDYWGARVAAVEREHGSDALIWGETSVKAGSERGEHTDLRTEEARPHAAYVMLERASDRLGQYSAAALRAGVDERRVKLAENQGAILAVVIRRVLDRMELTPEQQALVGSIVPDELRQVALNSADIEDLV